MAESKARQTATYRAARRNEAKAKAKAYGLSFVSAWKHHRLAAPVKYRPEKVGRSRYTPHIGAKQRAKAARLAHGIALLAARQTDGEHA